MHLRQLEYLRLVIETGSHAAAAKAAAVSQPAVTLALQALERELGFALFEKIGSKKVPTTAALAVARRAVAVHDKITAMRLPSTSAGMQAERSAGLRLRLGVSPAAALLYGPTVERMWHAREPQGILQIVSSGAADMLAALAGNELDVVIAPNPRRYFVPGIERVPLYTSTPAVYCRDGHPRQAAKALADIADATWAVTGVSGTPGNVIEEAHRVRGLPVPTILVHCADYTMLLNLVAQSDLLCVVPQPTLLRAVQAGSVRPLKITEGLPQYEVCMFWKADAIDISLLRAMADELRALPQAD